MGRLREEDMVGSVGMREGDQRWPVFIGKNIAKFPNLVSQLLFFCKFDFSEFFCIF